MFDGFCTLFYSFFGFFDRLDLAMGSGHAQSVLVFVLDGADHFLDVCVDHLLECVVDLQVSDFLKFPHLIIWRHLR